MPSVTSWRSSQGELGARSSRSDACARAGERRRGGQGAQGMRCCMLGTVHSIGRRCPHHTTVKCGKGGACCRLAGIPSSCAWAYSQAGGKAGQAHHACAKQSEAMRSAAAAASPPRRLAPLAGCLVRGLVVNTQRHSLEHSAPQTRAATQPLRSSRQPPPPGVVAAPPPDSALMAGAAAPARRPAPPSLVQRGELVGARPQQPCGVAPLPTHSSRTPRGCGRTLRASARRCTRERMATVLMAGHAAPDAVSA